MISPTGGSNEIGEESVKKWLDRVPMGRMAQADEIASTICFLLGNESSYISGQVIRVSGGEGD